MRKQIEVSNKTYAQFHDTRRRPEPDWKEGTKVWLNAKNIKTKRPAKKLDYKHFSPFKIIKKIGSHAYQLALPKTMNAIHNVFHVNLLSEDPKDYFPQRKQPPPPPIEVEGDKEYIVAEILDNRRRYGKMQYLVRWEGYGPEEDTWEPIPNLEGSQEIVHEFHDAQPKKTALKSGEWETEVTKAQTQR